MNDPEQAPCPVLTRRVVVAGGCAGALALGLGACATYDANGPVNPSRPPAGSGAGGPTIAAGDVPVGGGAILADQQVVVTQPVAGTFAAFGTTCPHQGCTVNEVAGGTINCPCHGSRFRVADGSVAQGPATTGLQRRQTSVANGTVQVV